MKKTLILLFSVIALFAFVATSFALHAVPENYEYTPSVVKSKKAQIELGGSIRMRGIYEQNNDLVDDADSTTPAGASESSESNDDEEANWDQRVRLHTKATVSPNTMGFIELETGDRGSADTGFGSCVSDARGVYGTTTSGNCKEIAEDGNAATDDKGLTIRQAYIAHQGTDLGVLGGFKIGHMLLALGNGMFFNHTDFGDDAVVLWMSPTDGTEIHFTTIKLSDSLTAGGTADDNDAYVLGVESAISNVNVSGDVTYVHDNTNPLGGKDLKLWNIGVRADADLGVVSIKGDVEFQTGQAEEAYSPTMGDFDVGGWAFLLGADFKIGEVNLGAEFAYGSGDDIDTEDEYEGFVTSLADGQRSTFLADYRLAGAGQSIGGVNSAESSTYAGGTNYGLNNHWYINVGADAKVHPDVKVSGDIYYLQASEKVANDVASTQDLEDTDMGWEIDAKVTYQIDTNLVYYVEGGYLIAGDFYKNATKGKDEDHFGDNNYSADPDNAYTIRHGLILSF